ncbi:MAG: response regulator [Acidobacteriota bacterium]
MTSHLRVMVLDDEPIVGRRLKPALEKMGLEVEVFEDPAEALARAGGTRFDIVVTDIRMRGIDGLEVLRRIRAASGRTKVILITGHASEDMAREALTQGAFGFIAKPFKTDQVRALVDAAARALADRPGTEGEETTDVVADP